MSKGMLIAAAIGLVAAGMAPSAPAAATVLKCDTLVHAQSDDLGIAACSNPTDETWMFRAVVVCSRALDVLGEWETLPPGAYGQSRGSCGNTLTGVAGVVGVEERLA
ncbi:hypothetical protein [Nonomuraea sp. NPDC049784]|uniref:hypothetical protein n=1 Tax=Nonomuraea sp. NPDC049784 TaxID=3154361 RepID=UPI0033F8CD49